MKSDNSARVCLSFRNHGIFDHAERTTCMVFVMIFGLPYRCSWRRQQCVQNEEWVRMGKVQPYGLASQHLLLRYLSLFCPGLAEAKEPWDVRVA